MTGCGVALTLGNGEVETCGTRYQLGTTLAPPLLCPACRGTQAMADVGLPVAPALCRACGELAPQRDSDFCWACNAEYARDMATLHDMPEPGTPGSRCSAGCGYCGRCGGA